MFLIKISPLDDRFKVALPSQFSKGGAVLRSLHTQLLPTHLLLGWVCGVGEDAGMRGKEK